MTGSPDILAGKGDKSDRMWWQAVQNRLRVLRAERGWSQAELAGRIEVSRQAVNAIETGKHDPSLALAFRISRVFGLTVEEVFHDDVGGTHG
jgi:putative transcriptional regulator